MTTYLLTLGGWKDELTVYPQSSHL